MQEQWSRLGRAVGNIFYPVLQAILPYVNAILMVLVEIANVVSGLLGFKMPEFDYSGLASASDSTSDLIDGMDEASASAEKLKTGLRGFDKLNNISTSSGSDSSASSGVDPAIMDAFNDSFSSYNDMMDSVNMKANKIRDAILDWLGFTDKTYKNLKIIGIILGAIAGLKLISGIKGLITGTNLLGRVLGTGGLYKVLSKLIKPIKILGAKDGLKYIFLTAKDALIKFLPILGKATVVLGGITATVLGTKGVYESMKKMREETEYGGKEFGKYTASVLATVGGATAVGAVLGGPLGAAIGGLVGVVIAGTSAWKGYQAGIEAIAKSQLFGSLSVSVEDWSKILESSLTNIDNFSDKMKTLKSNVEEYGTSFNNSSEALDLYGYKFGKLALKITEEDSVNILDAIENMGTQSSKIIQENTDYSLSIWGTAFNKMSTITEQEEKDILSSIYSYGEKQKIELSNAQNNITSTYDTAIKTRGYLTDEEYKYIQEQLKKIRQLTENEMTKSQANVEYYKTIFADSNLKLDEKSYDNFNKSLSTFNKEQQDLIEENYKLLLQDAKFYYDSGALTYEEYQKSIKTANQSRIDDEEKLRLDIDKINAGVYEDLANTYSKISGETDKVFKKQKTIIEDIFKDIKIDKNDIVSKFATIGKDAGKSCATNIGKGFNSKKLKLSLPDVNPFGLKNYSIPFTSSFAYANGGLPPVGQMFVANEKGPELVGQIGGKSFVANQNQMMDLLDKKIGSSSNGMQNATFIIQVGSEEIGKVVLKDLNKMAKNNGEPIVIGG